MGFTVPLKRGFDEVSLSPDAFYAAQQAAASAVPMNPTDNLSGPPPPATAAPPASSPSYEMRTRNSSGALSSGTTSAAVSSDGDSVCSSWSSEDDRRHSAARSAAASAEDGEGRRTKRRRKWGKTEDRTLRQVVAELQGTSHGVCTHGAATEQKISWSTVAKRIPTRSAKQCRDRWNSITPGIKKREWTKEEDDLLLRLYRIHKNSWVRIAKEFNGRNDNMLKSRFRSLCKRKRVKEMLAAPLSPALKLELEQQVQQQQMQMHRQESALPPPTLLPAAPRTASQLAIEEDLESFMNSCGAPANLYRGGSLGMFSRKGSLPPAPAPITVRETSGLFANLSFSDNNNAGTLPPAQQQQQQQHQHMQFLPPMQQMLVHQQAGAQHHHQQGSLLPPRASSKSSSSSGSGAAPPSGAPLDEELADWCAIMVQDEDKAL